MQRRRTVKSNESRRRTKRPINPRPRRFPITADDVIQSAFFRKAVSEAAEYAKKPERLKQLFEEARTKAKEIPRGAFFERWAYVMAMIRLIRAYYRGEYRDIPRQHFVIIVAAVLYFLTPADVISDWIPITGFVDDALVVSVALGAVRDDLDAFMGWETSQP
jgi:Uncharacterized conserved protein